MTDRGELAHAMTYFENAIKQGSPFEPYFYIAQIHSATAQNPAASSNLASGSCAFAVSFYKHVAERGSWKDNLLAEAESLWNEETSQSKEGAILRWYLAAERGYEVAQNNLAFVLDQGMCTALY